MDDEMQMALQMSMQTSETPAAETPAPAAPAAETPAAAPGADFYDASFVNNMLASLPGVDPDDPAIRDALAQIQAKQDEDAKGDQDKDKE